MVAPAQTVTLHKYQTMAFAAKQRFVALVAGTGGGKTYLGPPWLCNEIAQHPKDTWIILAPTYKILSRATMPTFCTFVEGTQFEGEYRESKGIYELPDGGIVYCLSADNWKGIEGGQFRAAWLDEAGQMNRMVWIAVQARIGLKQGRCLFTTTPYPKPGSDWLLDEVVSKALEGDKDYYCVQFKSMDNPYYPQEEYDRAKRSMSDSLFRMRYDGQFTKLSGLVWPDYDLILTDDDPYEIIKPEWDMYGGIDWGFRDPFVALVAAVDGEDTIHVFFERYMPRKGLPVHAQALTDMGLDNVTYFADPSGAQHIQDMLILGLPVRSASNDIMLGVEAVASKIKTNNLRIYERHCPNLSKEMAAYRYPGDETSTPTGAAAEKPIDSYNHACDALRYMVRGINATGNTVREVEYDDEEIYGKKKILGKRGERFSDIPSGAEVAKRGPALDDYDDDDASIGCSDRMRNHVASSTITDDTEWLSVENDALWQ